MGRLGSRRLLEYYYLCAEQPRGGSNGTSFGQHYTNEAIRRLDLVDGEFVDAETRNHVSVIPRDSRDSWPTDMNGEELEKPGTQALLHELAKEVAPKNSYGYMPVRSRISPEREGDEETEGLVLQFYDLDPK